MLYDYDADGNLASDGHTGFEFSYNILNLPMSAEDSADGRTMTYTYLSDGTKLKAVSGGGAGLTYRGSFVYGLSSGGGCTLESVATDEGRLVMDGTAVKDEWHVRDHVGNVRSVVWLNAPAGTGVSASILEQNDYLPFGTRLPGSRTDQSNRYRLGGKEEQDIAGMDLGLLDFGARYYDAYVGRWNAIDPLAHKDFSMSPYCYCGNDPVNGFDPDGMDIFEINNEGRIVNRIEDTTQDAFYMVEENDAGDYERTGSSVSFVYGTVESVRSILFEQPDGTKDTYDVYQIRGDDDGAKLFKFLARGVAENKMEVSQAKCGIEGDKGLNFVTTSHTRPVLENSGKTLRSMEYGMSYLYNDQLRFGYSIREINHSHPNSVEPSSFDKAIANIITSYEREHHKTVTQFNLWYVEEEK